MSNFKNEYEIVDSVIEGNINDYSQLVKKYQDKIFRFVYSKFYDYEEAKDITQEIFLIAMESIKSFRKEAQFSTWLYSIAINYCKNYKKKKNKIFKQSLSDISNKEIQLHDSRENIENKVIDTESLNILMEELYDLPEDYKNVLVLRDIEGISYAEISKILDISISNVKVRIHRGRTMLKNRLKARGLL